MSFLQLLKLPELLFAMAQQALALLARRTEAEFDDLDGRPLAALRDWGVRMRDLLQLGLVESSRRAETQRKLRLVWDYLKQRSEEDEQLQEAVDEIVLEEVAPLVHEERESVERESQRIIDSFGPHRDGFLNTHEWILHDALLSSLIRHLVEQEPWRILTVDDLLEEFILTPEEYLPNLDRSAAPQ